MHIRKVWFSQGLVKHLEARCLRSTRRWKLWLCERQRLWWNGLRPLDPLQYLSHLDSYPVVFLSFAM